MYKYLLGHFSDFYINDWNEQLKIVGGIKDGLNWSHNIVMACASCTLSLTLYILGRVVGMKGEIIVVLIISVVHVQVQLVKDKEK